MSKILEKYDGKLGRTLHELNERKGEIPDDAFLRMLEATSASYDIETIGEFDCLRAVGYVLGWEESLLLRQEYEKSIKRHLAIFQFILTRCKKTNAPKMLDLAVDKNGGHIGIVIDEMKRRIWHKQGSYPITITNATEFRDGTASYYHPPNRLELEQFLAQ